MNARKIAAVASMALMLGTGSALAWDLHDTLAPGMTPQTADTPPINEEVSDGADLRLPDVDIRIPDASGSAAVHDSRCVDALAQSGENSAEAWTFC